MNKEGKLIYVSNGAILTDIIIAACAIALTALFNYYLEVRNVYIFIIVFAFPFLFLLTLFNWSILYIYDDHSEIHFPIWPIKRKYYVHH